MSGLQLWGGHECTVNRIGDAFHDQTVRSGHHDRTEDLDRFAELGLRTLRYPVLWERVAPDRPDEMDWSWSDARLARLSQLGVAPVVGLVHHGSGPRYTHLLDPGFAAGLARFARATAERYPHVRDWTPVNEPLTTARFSALYGLWHPHMTDERAFWTALLNQIDAVRAAMREVRAVNPQARLIQTEDLGRTYATPRVAGQAIFDNARRWMTWDLLCGRVGRDHPLWERLTARGFETRLKRIADDPCPPDVLGINHYLTSDRFLDHQLDRYPPRTHGGNVMQRFADVEAIRVMCPAPGGLQGALEEAWARYGTTLAVTECHLGCTREDQLRWLLEAWTTAQGLREEGVDIEAVTAWSLLGAYDWNSLLTRSDGHYEAGAFDVSGPAPRPTALAAAVQALARGDERALPPAAQGAGWWRRDVRLSYCPVIQSRPTSQTPIARAPAPGAIRPILITGGAGPLAQALAQACEWRGLTFVATDRARLGLNEGGAIGRALARHRPWCVIDAAAWEQGDDPAAQPGPCLAAGSDLAVNLAKACSDRGVPYVGFSKAPGERTILEQGSEALVVRMAAVFSPFDPDNFAVQLLRDLAVGRDVHAADEAMVSPTYLPDLVRAVLDLAIDGERGVWDLGNEGAVTWAGFARALAAALGHDPGRVRPVPGRIFGRTTAAPDPAPLAGARRAPMPTLDSAIARFAEAVEQGGLREPQWSADAAIGSNAGLLPSDVRGSAGKCTRELLLPT